MQPLVLAIEPDVRQAAIVKRIVREKVLADVAVVDSRDAALEAMRTTVPDVLLLSALLSPRDEDELVAHLKSRRDAEHLQTHTIPQLASTFSGSESKPKGLLSAFKRKKGAETAPTGCDPDLFAEEIRTYLQRASEKKREARDAAAMEPVGPAIAAPAAKAAPAAPRTPETAPEPTVGSSSSWDSPFEWKPASARSVAAPVPEREPAPADPVPAFARTETVIAESAAFSMAPPPVVEVASVVVEPLPAFDAPLRAVVEAPAPIVEAHSWIAYDEPAAPVATPPKPRVKYPLSLRTARGWWFIEGRFAGVKKEADAVDHKSDIGAVLARLAVPPMIAGIEYPDGCRIRRVRLATA